MCKVKHKNKQKQKKNPYCATQSKFQPKRHRYSNKKPLSEKIVFTPTILRLKKLLLQINFKTHSPNKSNNKLHTELVKQVRKRTLNKYKNANLYLEETEFYSYKNRNPIGEFDNLVILGKNHFNALLFEVKSLNTARTYKKAVHQLKKEIMFLNFLYPKIRVYAFYVYFDKYKQPVYRWITGLKPKITSSKSF